MELDRQELPPPRRPQPPQRVPETNPPLLGDWFIYLSVIVLFCGIIAITALEFGGPEGVHAPLVRIPTLIASILLIPISADAAVRAWRSAGAWMPVDRGRGLFRYVWAAVLFAILAASVLVAIGMLVV